MHVEYLAVVPNKNYCIDVDGIKKLIDIDIDFSLDNDCIKYDGVEIVYSFKVGKTDSLNDRFFYLKFSPKENRHNIDKFSSFLRRIKKILKDHLCSDIYILWDGVSLYYSKLSYPIINELENTMRKLINIFMLRKFGNNWEDKSFPHKLNRISKKDRAGTILHSFDFDHLQVFLFSEYSTKDINNLFKIIKNEERDITEINKLSEFVPKSNWERFFSHLVNCNKEYLEKRWKKIYSLRNKVAHNSIISKKDYCEIQKISGELQEKLEEAIFQIDKINISSIEKDELLKQLNKEQSYALNEELTISLLNKNGTVAMTAGLNWGQRENRDPNQAYLPLPYEVYSSDFFPDSGIHFSVTTDDQKLLICTRAQQNGKALYTPIDQTVLGKYFRSRLGVGFGELLKYEHLIKYGRTDITFHKIDEENYFMDFSKPDNKVIFEKDEW